MNSQVVDKKKGDTGNEKLYLNLDVVINFLCLYGSDKSYFKISRVSVVLYIKLACTLKFPWEDKPKSKCLS